MATTPRAIAFQRLQQGRSVVHSVDWEQTTGGKRSPVSTPPSVVSVRDPRPIQAPQKTSCGSESLRRAISASYLSFDDSPERPASSLSLSIPQPLLGAAPNDLEEKVQARPLTVRTIVVRGLKRDAYGVRVLSFVSNECTISASTSAKIRPIRHQTRKSERRSQNRLKSNRMHLMPACSKGAGSALVAVVTL
jgi:hypothetical protein